MDFFEISCPRRGGVAKSRGLYSPNTKIWITEEYTSLFDHDFFHFLCETAMTTLCAVPLLTEQDNGFMKIKFELLTLFFCEKRGLFITVYEFNVLVQPSEFKIFFGGNFSNRNI